MRDFAGALRARSGWPRRCAAKQRDELAPLAVDMGLPPASEPNHKTRALSLPRVGGAAQASVGRWLRPAFVLSFDKKQNSRHEHEAGRRWRRSVPPVANFHYVL
jgi:hypothetical protein